MPYKVQKLPDGKYKITNKRTGRVIAYHTTKKNAEAQLRLLHYVNAQKGERYMKGGSNHLFNSEDEIENFFRYIERFYQKYNDNMKLTDSKKTILYLINYEYPSIDEIYNMDNAFLIQEYASIIGRNFLRMQLSLTSLADMLHDIIFYMIDEKKISKDIVISFEEFNDNVLNSYNEKKDEIEKLLGFHINFNDEEEKGLINVGLINTYKKIEDAYKTHRISIKYPFELYVSVNKLFIQIDFHQEKERGKILYGLWGDIEHMKAQDIANISEQLHHFTKNEIVKSGLPDDVQRKIIEFYDKNWITFHNKIIEGYEKEVARYEGKRPIIKGEFNERSYVIKHHKEIEKLLSESQFEDFWPFIENINEYYRLNHLRELLPIINSELPSIDNILEKTTDDNNAKEIGEKFAKMKLNMKDIEDLYYRLEQYIKSEILNNTKKEQEKFIQKFDELSQEFHISYQNKLENARQILNSEINIKRYNYNDDRLIKNYDDLFDAYAQREEHNRDIPFEFYVIINTSFRHINDMVAYIPDPWLNLDNVRFNGKALYALWSEKNYTPLQLNNIFSEIYRYILKNYENKENGKILPIDKTSSPRLRTIALEAFEKNFNIYSEQITKGYTEAQAAAPGAPGPKDKGKGIARKLFNDFDEPIIKKSDNEAGPSKRPIDEGGPSKRPEKDEGELGPEGPIELWIMDPEKPKKHLKIGSKRYNKLVENGKIVPQKHDLKDIAKLLEESKKPQSCEIIIDKKTGKFKNPYGVGKELESKTPYGTKIIKELEDAGYTIKFFDPGSVLPKINVEKCRNKETFTMFEDLEDVNKRGDLIQMPSGYCYSLTELIDWIKSQGSTFTNIDPHNPNKTLFTKDDILLPSIQHSKELVGLLNNYFAEKEKEAERNNEVIYKNIDVLYKIADTGRICYFDNGSSEEENDSSTFAYSAEALSDLAEMIEKLTESDKKIFKNLKAISSTVADSLKSANEGTSCIHGIGTQLIWIFIQHFNSLISKYPEIIYDPLKTGLYFISDKDGITLVNSETRLKVNTSNYYYRQLFDSNMNKANKKLLWDMNKISKEGLSTVYKEKCPNDPDISTLQSLDKWEELEEWRKFRTENGYCFDLLYLIKVVTDQINTEKMTNPYPRYPFNPFTFTKLTVKDLLKLKRQITNNYLIVASPLLKFLFNPEILWYNGPGDVRWTDESFKNELIKLFETDMRYRREFKDEIHFYIEDDVEIVNELPLTGFWCLKNTPISNEENFALELINDPSVLFNITLDLKERLEQIKVHTLPEAYYYRNNYRVSNDTDSIHAYNDIGELPIS